MKRLIRLLQYLYCIYALLLFIILMLLIFPLVLIALPLGKIRGGNIIYALCMIWGKTWYFLIGVQHREIYETPHNWQKQYIFVANHISYMDIPPLVLIAHQPIRVLGKAEMTRIPIFGWIYRAAVILVNRSNPETRARSVRALKAALRHGISIFIFPEGTFNETGRPLKNFFDGAFRVAIETATPIKPILLVDTVDRLHYRSVFELTPGPSRVVFLEEIPVAGLSMQDILPLKQKVYDAMEAALRRYRNYPTA